MTKEEKSEADQKTIYELWLHETKSFTTDGTNNILVTKVTGGWLYTLNSGHGMTTTFVPFVHNKDF